MVIDLCSYFQEGTYKFVFFWFRTLAKLNHIYPTTYCQCCICSDLLVKPLHIWWAWCLLTLFWRAVFSGSKICVSQILGPTPKSRKLRKLFSDIAYVVTTGNQSPTPTPTLPPLQTVTLAQILNDIMTIETLVSAVRDNLDKGHSSWTCWSAHREYVSFKALTQL